MKQTILSRTNNAYTIARANSIPVCMLVAANPNASWISGEQINIPDADWCINKHSGSSSELCEHTIALGETAVSLSNDFGISLRSLFEANGVSLPSQFTPGMRINIPKARSDRILYTVRGPETLDQIAKKHGIDISDIIALNPTVRGTYAGLQLLLPKNNT